MCICLGSNQKFSVGKENLPKVREREKEREGGGEESLKQNETRNIN